MKNLNRINIIKALNSF